MPQTCTLAILSDIHYACAAEQARGNDYEFVGVTNPVLLNALKVYRRVIWLRRPLFLNHLLDQFLADVGSTDQVIALGDYSCNTGFVGVSDDAACQSARECLVKLHERFGDRLHATLGDHDLGKVNLPGNRGGMRLASWHRAQADLGLKPFWRVELGRYTLLGVTSSLVALPVFQADTLPEEYPEWERLRAEHLGEIRQTFDELRPDRRVLLFCHDPTALPFLWRESAVREKLSQIEQTLIGHLHTGLIFWQSRLLAGIPPIHFLGHSLKRYSTALNEARHWRQFNVRLCPSLSGIELLKDGGFYTASLDLTAERPAQFQFHPLPR